MKLIYEFMNKNTFTRAENHRFANLFVKKRKFCIAKIFSFFFDTRIEVVWYVLYVIDKQIYGKLNKK